MALGASIVIGQFGTGVAVLLITALNALGGLRQQGKDLYRDKALGFTEQDVTAWFELWKGARDRGATPTADPFAYARVNPARFDPTGLDFLDGAGVVDSVIENFRIVNDIMTDEKGEDEKIMCVPLRDPAWGHVDDLDAFPMTLQDEIEHFFQVYKDLEEGKTETRGFGNRAEAERVIAEARERA